MGVKLRERQTKRGKRFYLDIYLGQGQRRSEFLDIWIEPSDSSTEKKLKRESARAIRNRYELDIEFMNYPDLLPKYRTKMSFLAYAKHYIENYPNRDARTVNSALKHFEKFLRNRKINNLSMTEFNEGIAFDFIDYLKKQSGLSASTPLGYYQKINGIIKSAIRDRYMLRNPFEFIDKTGLNKSGEEKKVLNTKELEKLINTKCSNEYIRRAFIIACYTGMGEAEIRNLKWSHIDFEAKTIKYVRAKTEVYAENFLHPVIEHQFFGLDRTTEFVFENILPKSTNGINKVLNTWVKHAKINKHITFYCGRHTFGTSVCRVSGNQKVVAQAMGHKSTRYTDRYTKLVEQEHLKAVKSLPNIILNNAI